MKQVSRKAPAEAARGPGRPSTIGASITLVVKVTPAMAAHVDACAETLRTGRSGAVRHLIELGLKAKGKAR